MIYKLLKEAISRKASDIHLTVSLPPIIRINGEMSQLDGYDALTEEFIEDVAQELLGNNYSEYKKNKNCDSSFSIEESRFRVHVFRQRGLTAIALRLIPTKIPKLNELNLPPAAKKFTLLKSGLVLVTGTTGSGKSTTLASMIDEINSMYKKHIITIEDPIEFVHVHKKSVVHQREVGTDVPTFQDAIRSAMREDPDILLVGEMRDLDTIQSTITMAETGHLVFATLHTKSAAEAIDRIIDAFPHNQQQQIRLQLSSVIQGIITQTLLPSKKFGRVPACELLIANDSIRSLIREGSSHNAIVDQILLNHKKLGSQTFDQSLAFLYSDGLITYDVALDYTTNEEELKGYIARQRGGKTTTFSFT